MSKPTLHTVFRDYKVLRYTFLYSLQDNKLLIKIISVVNKGYLSQVHSTVGGYVRPGGWGIGTYFGTAGKLKRYGLSSTKL